MAQGIEIFVVSAVYIIYTPPTGEFILCIYIQCYMLFALDINHFYFTFFLNSHKLLLFFNSTNEVDNIDEKYKNNRMTIVCHCLIVEGESCIVITNTYYFMVMMLF